MEFRSCFVVERRILFGFFVELYINLDKLVDSAFLYSLTVSPLAESYYLLTELSSPVTEMVYADAVITGKLVEQLQRVTDDCRAEVTDMERLAYVGGGIVKNDCLSLSFV